MAIYPNTVFKIRGSLLFWLGLLALLALMATLWSFHTPATPVIPLAIQPMVAPKFGQLPLSFIPNAGQTDPAVRFQVNGYGGTLFFTPAEVTLVLPGAAVSRPPTAKHPAVSGQPPTVVSMRFVEANPGAEIIPAERLPGLVNYFKGNDPAQWQTQLPTYAEVTYRELYPGIDLRYDGAEGLLKGTYLITPGADPAQIRWRYEGAKEVQIDETSGDLIIELAATSLTERAPVAWQEIEGRRVSVAAHYALISNPIETLRSLQSPIISLDLGSYNPAYPLIVDPTLEYSTYLGGSSNERGFDLAVDSAGNVYMTGYTESLNFPTANPHQNSRQGSRDAFVTKLNATGTLEYSTFFGGSGSEGGHDIAIDAAGNAYIIGVTNSANLPTVNPLQAGLSGLHDAFVTKFSANGSSLLYSTYLGGSYDECNDDYYDQLCAIAVDSAGQAIVTGDTQSLNFPTFRALYGASTNGADEDAFVAKLNAAGNGFVYSTYLGGLGDDYSTGVALDQAGNAYVTGATFPISFPISANAAQRNSAGGIDAFVTKLNATGSALLYSTLLGGSNDEIGHSIVVDSAGNAYLTGETWSSDFPTLNPLQPNFGSGLIDAFVAKLNSPGSAFEYATFLGGSNYDQGYDIALDSLGSAYVTGETWSTNFPTVSPLQATLAGQPDAFVSRLSPSGNQLYFSTYLGGSGQNFFGANDVGYGIGVDSAGSIYVTGFTDSDAFPRVNPLQANRGGVEDLFLTKITNTSVFTINPASGAILTDGASFTITIPTNSFTSTTEFHLTSLPQPQHPLGNLVAALGWSFRFDAYQGSTLIPSFAFNSPINFVFVYQEAELGSLMEPTLKLYYYNESQQSWANAADTCPAASRLEQLNPAANRLTVNVCHLSEFALLGETRRVYLPLLLRPN